MAQVFVNGAVKDCCKDAANLVVVPEESNAQTGLTTRRCVVCGCRHRRLHLEPGTFGLAVRPRKEQA